MENSSEWTYSIPNFNNSYTSCDLLSSCSLNMLQNQYGKDHAALAVTLGSCCGGLGQNLSGWDISKILLVPHTEIHWIILFLLSYWGRTSICWKPERAITSCWKPERARKSEIDGKRDRMGAKGFKNGKQTRICLLKVFLNKYGKEVFYALQSAFQLRQMNMLIEQIR